MKQEGPTVKNLIIIAGASGDIGKAFIKKLTPHFPIIGISRNSKSGLNHKNLAWFHIDLSRPEEVEKAVSELNLTKYSKVILIHAIGQDKFENVHYPRIEPLATIDPVVYDSTVNTYKYLANALIQRIRNDRKNGWKARLVLSTIAGVADKYGMIFLTSFVESKNIVRMYMRNATEQFDWISALVINITSTATKAALLVRPYANINSKTWLTPEEVVDRSVPLLLRKKKGYAEIDIIKSDPDFNDYYKNNHRMYIKWASEVWGPNGQPK